MKKSLLLSAILNMAIPGASYLYIGKGWKKAIVEFISGIALWALCFLFARGWNAPFFYLLVPILFFIDGLTLAKNYNKLLVNQP